MTSSEQDTAAIAAILDLSSSPMVSPSLVKKNASRSAEGTTLYGSYKTVMLQVLTLRVFCIL
jgi:hypothetical protein